MSYLAFEWFAERQMFRISPWGTDIIRIAAIITLVISLAKNVMEQITIIIIIILELSSSKDLMEQTFYDCSTDGGSESGETSIG